MSLSSLKQAAEPFRRGVYNISLPPADNIISWPADKFCGIQARMLDRFHISGRSGDLARRQRMALARKAAAVEVAVDGEQRIALARRAADAAAVGAAAAASSRSGGIDDAGAATTATRIFLVAAPISVPSDCPIIVCAQA